MFGSLSVADNIRVAAEMRGLDDPARIRDELLDRVGLRAFADAPADSVPTGIARLTELARALGLTGTPSYVVGDRILAGLAGVDGLTKAIAEVKQAVLRGRG